MIKNDPLEILERAPLWGGLDLTARQAALEVARMRHFSKKEFLFQQGEPAETFYILLEGRARLTQINPEGHQVIISYLGTGAGIGIIVVLSNMPYPLSAQAVTDCSFLAWNSDTTLQLMERFPKLAINGMRLVAKRFRQLQNQHMGLITERVEQRMARALLRLARQAGKKTDQGVMLDLPLSRQDLAELTGTTLYTVSRICRQWEQAGLVRPSREKILILNLHGLESIAEDLPEA